MGNGGGETVPEVVSASGDSPQQTMRLIRPFYRSLGTVRVARQVSGLHILFVGPTVCARHGFYANVHLHADFISYLTTSLVDVAMGRVEELTVAAAREVMERRRPRPEALMLDTGCEDELLCTDFEAIARAVEAACGVPTVHFGKNRMFVDGRGSFFPTFHRSLFGLLGPVDRDGRAWERDRGVNIIGSISRLRPGGDFEEVLRAAGCGPVRTLKTARTFGEFCEMARSAVNVVIDDDYLEAARDMERRLGIPYIYRPVSYDLDEVGEMYEELASLLGVRLDWRPRRDRALRRLDEVLAGGSSGAGGIGSAGGSDKSGGPEPFALYGVGIADPWSCAEALASRGLPVRSLTVMLEDEPDERGRRALASLTARNPSFTVERYDYKGNMPVVAELGPLEPEFYGFAAFEHMLDLVVGGRDYS